MNKQGKKDGQQDTTELSQVYSELARETVPPELDTKVLGLAETDGKRITRNWSTPVAIAATVTICFSLLLQFTDKPQEPRLEPRGAPSLTPDQSTPVLQRAAPSEEAGNRITTTPASEEISMPMSADAVERADEFSVRDSTDARGAISAQPRAVGSASRDASCPATSRENPVAWWRCIAELRDTGLSEEANEERRLLGLAFPEFIPPE